jgi:dihydrolipoamide dehydrogenase
MSLYKIILFITLVLILIVAQAILPEHDQTLGYVKSQYALLHGVAEAYPRMAEFAFLITYILTTALNLPVALLLSLLAGSLFDLWIGVIVVSLGSTLGATGSFLISRYLLREAFESRFPSAIRKINTGVQQDGAFYLFALRLVPVFPFFVINAAMGLTKLPTYIFFLISQIGMLPATIIYVYAGTQLTHLSSINEVFPSSLALALTLIGILPLASRMTIHLLRNRRLYSPFLRPSTFDYNIIVIGGGAAGLVTSYIGSSLKAKVLLIEEAKMGGDCLNTGCVPSKSLIHTADFLHKIRLHKQYGIATATSDFSFSEVMERVISSVNKIEPHDSIERYTKLGVNCIIGRAKILDPFRVAVNGETFTTRNIVIATGAKPIIPRIPGISRILHYTSDTIWTLREQPKHLLVVGGGPIGCELGQAFRRLGTTVTIAERDSRLLSKEEPEASTLIGAQLSAEDVRIMLNHEVIEITEAEDSIQAVLHGPNEKTAITCDAILFAIGRKANTEGLGLQELGVALRQDGTIQTDEYLRTKYPNILACGDVTGPYQLTHVSAHQAWYSSINALFQPFKKYVTDYRVIPRVTFTDPQIAQVGVTSSEAKEQLPAFDTYSFPLNELDRAIIDNETNGFIQVLTKQDTDHILGVTIVGAHAGEYLSEFTLAMKHNIGLKKILETIHPYPTFSEANKYVAGAWRQSTKPAKVIYWLQRFHAWRRG